MYVSMTFFSPHTYIRIYQWLWLCHCARSCVCVCVCSSDARNMWILARINFTFVFVVVVMLCVCVCQSDAIILQLSHIRTISFESLSLSRNLFGQTIQHINCHSLFDSRIWWIWWFSVRKLPKFHKICNFNLVFHSKNCHSNNIHRTTQ